MFYWIYIKIIYQVCWSFFIVTASLIFVFICNFTSIFKYTNVFSSSVGLSPKVFYLHFKVKCKTRGRWFQYQSHCTIKTGGVFNYFFKIYSKVHLANVTDWTIYVSRLFPGVDVPLDGSTW